MNKLWTFGDSFTAGHGCKHFDSPESIAVGNLGYYENLYKSYIDDNKKIWPEILSDYFDYKLENLAINGITNDCILDHLLKNIPFMTNKDLVILQTSTPARYDFPFLKEKTLVGGQLNKHVNRTSLIYEMNDSPYFMKTIFTSNIQSEWKEELVDSLQYTNVSENLNNKGVLLNKNKYNNIRNFFAEFVSTEKYYDISIWRFIQISNLLSHIGIKNYIINESKWPLSLPKPKNLMEMNENGMLGYVIQNKKTIKYETNNELDDVHPGYSGHIDIANFIINFIDNANTDIYKS